MKRFIQLVVMLATMVTIYLVSALLSPKFFYPYVSVTAPDSGTSHILNTPIASENRCQRQIDAISKAVLANCANCAITNSLCLDSLDKELGNWLGETPIPFVSLKNSGGTVIFDQGEFSMANCEVAANQSNKLNPLARSHCFAENAERSHYQIKQPSAVPGYPPQILTTSLLFSIGAFVLLLVIRKFGPWTKPSGNAAMRLTKLLLATGDVSILLASVALIAGSTHLDKQLLFGQLTLVGVAITIFWIYFEHYGRRRPFWDELREIFRANVLLLLLAYAMAFYTNSGPASLAQGLPWIAAFALLPLTRSLVRGTLDHLGLWKLPTLIVGTGSNSREAYFALKSEPTLGYQIIGFGDHQNDVNTKANLEIDGQFFPIIGLEIPVAQTLAAMGNPQIVIALDNLLTPENHRLAQTLATTEKNIHIIPSLRGLPLFGTQLSHFFSHEVLFMTVRNNLARRSYQWVKRGFDLSVGLMLLVLLSPLFLVLIFLIRRNGGTAFFGHTRIGQNGTPFKCLKFRSMRPDAEAVLKDLLANDPVARAEWEKDFKLKNDPRITPVGHFLRKTSLDELPQLINVIKGEMSLVGPRPVIQTELERYGEAACFYLEAKPGVTGLWQVSGRNDTTYAERVSLDSWYVQNWSLWYDIAILFKTIDVVLGRKGAY